MTPETDRTATSNLACSVNGCVRPVAFSGRNRGTEPLCAMHYRRMSRSLKGEGKIDMDAPAQERGLVSLPAPRVPEDTYRRIVALCAAQGMSTYEFLRWLVDRWDEGMPKPRRS